MKNCLTGFPRYCESPEENNSLFYRFESIIMDHFQISVQIEKKHHISSFLFFDERQPEISLTSFQSFKLYDHIGYVAGYRLQNAIKYRLIKEDVALKVAEFVKFNFYENKEEAMQNGMPANLVYFRDKFNGLKCSKIYLLNLFMYIEQMFSTIMNVNFMIMFNAENSCAQVSEKIMSSPKAQKLFCACFFFSSTNDFDPLTFIEKGFFKRTDYIGFIWRYLVNGYLNVNFKHKFKDWLKNAIGSNVGSTTRVELAVASKMSEKVSNSSNNSNNKEASTIQQEILYTFFGNESYCGEMKDYMSEEENDNNVYDNENDNNDNNLLNNDNNNNHNEFEFLGRNEVIIIDDNIDNVVNNENNEKLSISKLQDDNDDTSDKVNEEGKKINNIRKVEDEENVLEDDIFFNNEIDKL